MGRRALGYYDTAPFYGNGLSELRLGEALEVEAARRICSLDQGRPAPQTPTPQPYRIEVSGSIPARSRSFMTIAMTARCARSKTACSAWRWSASTSPSSTTSTISSHLPEVQEAHFRTAMDGAYKALDKLRSEGLVKSIGVGCNECCPADQALRGRDFWIASCSPGATRCSGTGRVSIPSCPLCEARNVAIALGGGYNSGILATGAVNWRPLQLQFTPELIPRCASAPSKGFARISA